MLAFILAALVAIVQPAAGGTVPPPVLTTRPSAAGDETNSGDAIIRTSGSTNTGGYTIVLHVDGSADISAGGTTVEHTTVGTPQARWLFRKLREAMPLASLRVRRCLMSASFGSSTVISYEGQSTPDLSCGGDGAARELMRTVRAIAQAAGMSSSVRVGPGRPIPPVERSIRE